MGYDPSQPRDELGQWSDEATGVKDTMMAKLTKPELKQEIETRFAHGLKTHVDQERRIRQERSLGMPGGQQPDHTPAATWASSELRAIATNLKAEGKM